MWLQCVKRIVYVHVPRTIAESLGSTYRQASKRKARRAGGQKSCRIVLVGPSSTSLAAPPEAAARSDVVGTLPGICNLTEADEWYAGLEEPSTVE